MTSSTTKMSLKLLIDTKNEKVLYAEASKSVIDFLFNLLRLPISAVVKILSTNNMVGSLGNLFESVENLDQIYMQPNQTKDVLLNLGDQGSSTEISDFLIPNNDKGTKLYMCPNKCRFEVTNDITTRCNSVYAEVISSTPSLKYDSSYSNTLSGEKQIYPDVMDYNPPSSVYAEVISSTPSLKYYSSCSNTMSREKHKKNNKQKKGGKCKSGVAKDSACSEVMDRKPLMPVYRVCGKYMSCEVNYIGSMKVGENGASMIENGFVKDDVIFWVMDDLLIQPMSLSTISSTITLLNNLNINEVGTLQEKIVEIGMDEGMKLLEASLQSKMVLTSVFIKIRKEK